LNIYLTFDGQCEAAFRFYARCLGGTPELLTYRSAPTPAPVPPDWQDKVMHARLAIGEQVLMGCDAPPDRQEAMRGFSVSLGVDRVEDAERIFAALAENATVRMPMQQTFWAARFGMLVDRFGVPWMINCEGGAAAHDQPGAAMRR